MKNAVTVSGARFARVFRLAVVGGVVLVSLVAGCGGGGGGGSSPQPVSSGTPAGNGSGSNSNGSMCPAVDASLPDGVASCGGSEDTICVADFDGQRVSNLVAVGGGQWPEWSPDGSQLAFQRLSSAGAEIFVMAADGGEARRLAAGLEPTWSPDGSQIAYRTVDGIEAAPVDGGDPVTIIRNDELDEGSTGAGQPDWSADGQRLVFGAVTDVFDSLFGSVFLVSADGADLQHLYTPTDHGKAETGFPVWSPAGDEVALALGGSMGIVRASGSEPRLLARDIVDFDRLAWSPSGTAIAYTANLNCGSVRSLHLVPASGGSSSSLVRHAEHPAWSPDGSRIAFLVRRTGVVATAANFAFVIGTLASYTSEQPDSFGNLSRYVFLGDDRFELQYSTRENEFVSYTGSHSRSGSRIFFDFDAESIAGPWEAIGTADEQRLVVEYNTVMMLSDFEDATYLLDAD